MSHRWGQAQIVSCRGGILSSRAVLSTVTKASLERIKLFMEFSDRALSLAGDCMLRQCSGLSSFSIPDEPLNEEVWISGNQRPQAHEFN